MKKLALIVILCIGTLLSVLAVPSGAYSDDRGKNKVLVTSNQEIHLLDKDGKVRFSLTIIKENPDGSFTTKDKLGNTYERNAWWKENGEIYLNLHHKLKTLTRE